MDEQGDENQLTGVKDASGESSEVFLSEPLSGEDSSLMDTRENPIGIRDDEAAQEYMKRTTTETEPEDLHTDEEPARTTYMSPPDIMAMQSNVVPAPTDALHFQQPTPAGDTEGGDGSRRNSEDGNQEISVAPSSVQADLNEDLDSLNDIVPDDPSPESGTLEFVSPTETMPQTQDEGSVKIIEGDGGTSGRASSVSLGHYGSEHDTSSPTMFLDPAQTRSQDSLCPDADLQFSDRGLDPDVFTNVGKLSDPEQELDSKRQTMEAMAQETVDLRPRTEPSVSKDPPVSGEKPPIPSGSGSVQRPADPSAPKKGGLPGLGLPGRKGPSLPKTSSSGSTSQPKPPAQPRQSQEQQQPSAKPPPAGLPSLSQNRPPANPPPAMPRLPSNPQASLTPSISPDAQTRRPAAVASNVSPEDAETHRKLLEIRLTMLRIAARLGMRPLDFLVTDFMAKVDRAEQVRFRDQGIIRPQLDTLFSQATELDEQSGPNSNLEITVTAVVLGPAGSGKTSVINNILNSGPGLVSQFPENSTDKVTIKEGRVCGVNFRLIDTPGLSVAASALKKNMSILKEVRKAIQKYKPDTAIYVDRMDLFRRELSDIPLLRLINDMLPELLYNCIALLTRAGAPPPDAGHGLDMPYAEYQRLRLDLCTQIITHAISDMRWAGKSLGFENHPHCRVNSEGSPLLPNGQAFKKQATFLLVGSHMARQMEKVCKTKNLSTRTLNDMLSLMQPRKQLQLSALVSQLLAPKPPKKFPDEERELMTKREINRLTSEAKKIDEENKRRDYTRLRKVEILQEEAHPSQVPIVGATMELSPSFDHEVNQHRYNATDFVYGWSVRPIMSAQDNIFEHDDGVEMFQVARDGVLRKPGTCIDGFPFSMIIQAGKGKNIGNIQMDTGMSYYPTRNTVATIGAVVHPAGQDGEVVYTPTMDVRFKIAEKDKLTIGGMACRLAESGWPHKGQLGLGGKIENKYKIKDGVKVSVAGGAMTVKPSNNHTRDVAYGANMELKLAGGKGEYDPNLLLSCGVSHQRRGAFKRTGISGQISHEQALSPESMLNTRLQLSAGGSGTGSVRMITHDKPGIGWLMAIPIVIKSVKRIIGRGDDYV